MPNLFYGKTLIELAQLGENKLLVLPEQEEDEDEDDDDSNGNGNGNGGDNENKTKPGDELF